MHCKIFYFLIFFWTTSVAFAQTDYHIQTDRYSRLHSVPVLIDKGYSFDEILNNPELTFKKQSKIKIKNIDYYWIKCSLTSSFAYDKTFAVWTHPFFDSELYFFNEEIKKWQSVRGGEKVVNNISHFKYMPFVLKANQPTTLYIKVNVTDLNQSTHELATRLSFENEAHTIAYRKKNYDWWLITVAIVLAFLVYNLYWYVMIREKVYFYYLVMLVGGLIYITSVGFFMTYFISINHINAQLNSDGFFDYKTTEFYAAMFGQALVLFGFVQFTRLYLKSKMHVPQWDQWLKYTFVLFAIIILLFVSGEYFKWISTKNYFGLVNNLVFLLIIIMIVIISIKSAVKKTPESKYFLSALFIPFFFLLAIIVSLIVLQNNSFLNIVPNLSILSITITFGIILVAKVNLIKKELSLEKFEKQAIFAQNEIEKERNLRLQEKIEYDKNEVAAAQHIKLLMKELHHRVKNNLQIVSSLLSLQSFRIKDQTAIDAVKEGQHRIEAMSLIHQKLYIQDNITQVNIHEFITDIAESLMEAYGYQRTHFQLEINVSETLLDVDKAIPLSIIINELITNAFKYAYASIENPALTISFSKQAENASLLVSDNGIGMDVNAWKNNDGYGKELVQTFTEQLSGTLTLIVNNGTTFRIDFPY